MSNPRGYNGSRAIREQRTASLAMARRTAADWSDNVGMSYHAANRLYERFKQEAALYGDRVSSAPMKVGV